MNKKKRLNPTILSGEFGEGNKRFQILIANKSNIIDGFIFEYANAYQPELNTIHRRRLQDGSTSFEDVIGIFYFFFF